MPSPSISRPTAADALRHRAAISTFGAFLRFASITPVISIMALSGCARAVLPSEKAFLADPIMQFDEDGLEVSSDTHIVANREGSAGGSGTTGGGCGCN